MTYEDTPIDGLSVVDATDDPWLEIANKWHSLQRRTFDFVASVSLPEARDIGEMLVALHRQYDDKSEFLVEAEARVVLHKTQVYALMRVANEWAELQAGIDAGSEIGSIKAAVRFLSGAFKAPKALKSAADPDAEDGDHTGAECPLPAPAAVVSTVVDVDAPAAAKGPTPAALAALVAVPAACSQLMAEVPTDRPDLVKALGQLHADAESLARQIRSAMAREVVSIPVEVCQIELPEPAPGVDPADQLMADALGMDVGDIARGGAPEVAADSAGGKAKKGGSNRGVIANRFPKTPKGAQALLAELDRHKGDKDAFVAELGCTVRALDQNLVKYRAILAEAQP